ncbi:hypothetical protein WN48_04906 [Eufriesea mexicana]|uniref:Uncharacterized protein n=1 Tax=Eufriesea mexicana TaxID=516756 RepID=A0A310SD64_9HYME|nr:hypothetical protein WN48_04906 [Eufriesea mexicana]
MALRAWLEEGWWKVGGGKGIGCSRIGTRTVSSILRRGGGVVTRRNERQRDEEEEKEMDISVMTSRDWNECGLESVSGLSELRAKVTACKRIEWMCMTEPSAIDDCKLVYECGVYLKYYAWLERSHLRNLLDRIPTNPTIPTSWQKLDQVSLNQTKIKPLRSVRITGVVDGADLRFAEILSGIGSTWRKRNKEEEGAPSVAGLLSPFGCLRFNTTETSGPAKPPKGKRQNEPTSGPQQAPPRVHNVLLVGMASADVPVPRCTCDVRNLATCSAVNQNSPTSRVVRSYRPHGSLARLLYDKQKADEQLETFDKTQFTPGLRVLRGPSRSLNTGEISRKSCPTKNHTRRDREAREMAIGLVRKLRENGKGDPRDPSIRSTLGTTPFYTTNAG